jgi:transposase-like protein
LYDAIGMPNGFVISSDMQKGLVETLSRVYPLAEHRECMRHLYKNLKKHFKSKKLKSELWQTAQTYSIGQFQKHTLEMEATSPAVMTYLRKEHNKFWSKSQFGTIAKCDYITNNIAETFNSWISDSREKPVLDLLDSIRQKIMVRFNEKKRIARNWKGPLVPKVEKHIRSLSRVIYI